MVVTGLGAARRRPRRGRPGGATGRAGPSWKGGSPPDAAALAVADEAGAEADDDGALIAVRTVSCRGPVPGPRRRARGARRRAGRGWPSSALAVHGQSDQLRLLRPAEQRARWTGSPATPWACRCSGTGRCAPSGRRSRPSSSSGGDGAGERAQEADLLRLGLDEIEAVDPQPGEDGELREEARRLGAADDLREAAGSRACRHRGGPTRWTTPHRLRVALVGEARAPARRVPATARSPRWPTVLGDAGAARRRRRRAHRLPGRLDTDPARLAARLGAPGGADGADPQVRRRHRRGARLGRAGPDAAARPRRHRRARSAELAARRDAAGRRAGRAAPPLSPRPAPRRRRGWPTASPPSWAGWPCRDARLLVAVTAPTQPGPGAARRAAGRRRVARGRARTASTRSSCCWPPTPARTPRRCTRARPAVSCPG